MIIRKLSVIAVLFFLGVGSANTATTRAKDVKSSEESWSQLANKARYIARHGGVKCRIGGCDTPQLKAISLKLIKIKFGPKWKRAACYAGRESGLNPGAISDSGDYGLGQINLVHKQFDFAKLGAVISKIDPAYQVNAMYRLAHRAGNGHEHWDWSAWKGGSHPCYDWGYYTTIKGYYK